MPLLPIAASSANPEEPGARGGNGGQPSSTSMSVLLRVLACLDAGDRCAEYGDRNRALVYYGRALNDLLAEGLFTMAASVAQRMVDRYPSVVRARATLAVLSLCEGLRVLTPSIMRSIRAEFQTYVRAARAAGQGTLAVRLLRRLAAETDDVLVGELMADLLEELGDDQGAAEIRSRSPASADEAGSPRPPLGDPRGRWAVVLRSSPESSPPTGPEPAPAGRGPGL